MKEIKDDDIKKTINKMANALSWLDDLNAKKKEDLEKDWHWKWDSELSAEKNLYKFHDCLNNYAFGCRKWETHHNGGCCVVERVRDQYLIPKAQLFFEEYEKRK